METKNLGDLEKSIKDTYASLGAKEAVIRLNQIRDNDDHDWDTYDKICFDIAIAELEDVVVASFGRLDAKELSKRLSYEKRGTPSHGSPREFREGYWAGLRKAIEIVDEMRA